MDADFDRMMLGGGRGPPTRGDQNVPDKCAITIIR